MAPIDLTPVLDELLGRDWERHQLKRHLTELGLTTCVILRGNGGIGKTRLLIEVQKLLNRMDAPVPAIYDFYHPDNFKASQIEAALCALLQDFGFDTNISFKQYDEQSEELDRVRQQSGKEFFIAQHQLRETFIKCYNKIAARVGASGQRIVLLFDTIEQSHYLTDPAEKTLVNSEYTASDGGEFWLREMLPQLEHTLIIISGRDQTLYGQPVTLYNDLQHKMGHHCSDIELTGLKSAGIELFVERLQHYYSSYDRDPTTRESAQFSVKPLLPAWISVSDGIPFWIAMLFTGELLGTVPNSLRGLYEQTRAGKDVSLDTEKRTPVCNEVMLAILGGLRENADPIVQVMQWMATARQGVNQEVLRAIAKMMEDSEDPIAINRIFERLSQLLIVRRRPDPLANPLLESESIIRLSLHDEMHSWLDRYDTAGTIPLRRAVTAALISWYSTSIEATRAQRIAAQNAEVVKALHRCEQQLLLERMGYYYQSDRREGIAEYNLLSYAAILSRESDYGITLRQEILRHIYWLDRTVSEDIAVECAARWVLRAVHAEERERSMDVIERLVGLYNYSADHKGSHYELLRLAVIQALVYVHGADERVEQIFTDTKQFVTAREQAHIAATDIFEPSETWLDILAAQLLNFKGYFYRLRYQLDQSQRQYQRSIALAERHAGMLPQLRATTLNNLAFVLSEQGNVTESRRIAKEALQLRKYYSSRYDVGTSYNTLARIEIRAGHPQQARRHADRAIEIFKQLKSIRGRSLCLPVLAETYRKEAELLDLNDEQDEQSMLFEKAVTILHEALNELTMHNIKLPERWREAYQRLGCTHRSWGHALHERDRTNPAAAEQFKQAHHYLTQAYEVSLGHQPNLILMDIQEDLAVVYVNQDEYDQRIEYHLNKAEELAPAEYKIQFGFGLSRPNSAVTGYWRILGQCELQRMLASFGAYDYGYNQHSDDGTQIRVRYQDPQDLVAAGQHMLLSLAYLTMYARESPMLELAEELMLRELRFRRGEDKLKIISASLDETARLYHLQENDAYKIVDDLLAQVRPNPMLL